MADADWLKKKPSNNNPLRMNLRRSAHRFYPRSVDMDLSLMTNSERPLIDELPQPRIKTNIQPMKMASLLKPVTSIPKSNQSRPPFRQTLHPSDLRQKTKDNKQLMGPPKVPPVTGLRRTTMYGTRKSTFIPSAPLQKRTPISLDVPSRFLTLSIDRPVSKTKTCFPSSVEKSAQSNFPGTPVHRSSPSRDDNAPRSILKQSEQISSRLPLPKSSQVKEKKEKRRSSGNKPRAAKKVNFEIEEVEKENKRKSLPKTPTLARIGNRRIKQYADGSPFSGYSLLDETLAEVSSSIAALCIPPSPIVDTLEAIQPIASTQSEQQEEYEPVLKLLKKYQERMNNMWNELQADLKSMLTKGKKINCNEGVIQNMVVPGTAMVINIETDQAQSPIAVPLEISVQQLSEESLHQILQHAEMVPPSESSTNRPLDSSNDSESASETLKKKQEMLETAVPIRKSSRSIRTPQKFLDSNSTLRKVAGKSKAIKKKKHLTLTKLDKSASSKRKQKSSVYKDLQKSINLDSTEYSTDELEDFSPGNTPLNTPARRRKMSKRLQLEISRLLDSV